MGGERGTEAVGGRRKTPPGTLPGGREGCFLPKAGASEVGRGRDQRGGPQEQ